MPSTLSSANSYTSTSGNTSVPVMSSSLTSGFIPSSSSSQELLSRQKKLGGKLAPLVAGLPLYTRSMSRPGDVFFHANGGAIGHTNIVSSDVSMKVDSVDGVGVRKMPMARDNNSAIVFRFYNADLALRAALVVEEWANNYDNGTYARNGVGYSGGPTAGIGITGRVIGALLGSSKFGTGARARLLKYRNRTGMMPKHVICSEMCTLAFQLCMAETEEGFIKLDAKHTLPSNLCNYFLKHTAHWSLVGWR
ncbi:hypothetical protein EOD42_21230 [Rhodovarius crocodyli]|uniref:Uncharacterized protein n=1 Tax=Rhodovarius crocodyli TaxID=1979269 RepID=A0A437M294_9PROT|nr:hypothetical protein [Rhodovarius crocodyli]RVT91839.1 hypothetical protein EOD42_21230 [Rhodovarius crocodyli]